MANTAVRFPISEAALQIVLNAGRGLITVLSSLGEELHNDCGEGRRKVLSPFGRRQRLSCNVTVHPLHWVRGGKWKRAGEHLVQRDAQRVEIAPVVDRAVHAARLLGSDVSERTADHLRRPAALWLARQSAPDTQPP